MSLAAVNQICVNHEAMNGCRNVKIHLRIASIMKIFDNVFAAALTDAYETNLYV